MTPYTMPPIPQGALFILDRLASTGHTGYVVGGCVRDALLGRSPNDWDVCTGAKPHEMQAAFADCRVIETGLKHGTLTVLHDGEPYEVTTFRVDGEYTDHRHPDEVIFVENVIDDLARRDFTINAMAWNPSTGLVDAFGGQEDLKRRLIRCVGEPEKRFTEDALRILRALRFASVYNFLIEEKTAQAIHALKHTLHGVAAERIRVELCKLLCGRGAADILRQYSDVIFEILPWLQPMEGFEQHKPGNHAYDVWEHTLHALDAVEQDEILRLTMLLHDSGKPEKFYIDETGGHTSGHPKASKEIARKVLEALRVDNTTFDTVLTLVENHDIHLSEEKRIILRRLNQFGEEGLDRLISIHRADGIGKGTLHPEVPNAWARDMRKAVAQVLSERPCFTLRDLAVNGRDLMSAGVAKGPLLGQTLQRLLEQVMDGGLPNEKEALLEAALIQKE